MTAGVLTSRMPFTSLVISSWAAGLRRRRTPSPGRTRPRTRWAVNVATGRTYIGPFVLTAMVCGLSAAFLFEWRASRSSAESLSASVGRTLKAFGHETEVLSSRLAGVANSLSGVEETLLQEKGLLLQIAGLLKESLGAEKRQTG